MTTETRQTPAYAKLEERLSKAAGAHYGEGRAIYDDQGATASTHMHELIHDRIFYETADGIFHLLAFRVAADMPNTRPGRTSRKIAAALFDDTRVPHEAAATYMGLMYGLVDLVTLKASGGLAKGTRPAEYEHLPADYQEHYRMFGDLFDPYLRSAWLRLAVTWPIVHWAFSSQRLAQLSSTLVDGKPALDELPGPAFRLTAALRAIRNAGVVEWLAQTLHEALVLCAKEWVTWEDVDDDGEWPDTAGAPKAETTVQSLFKTIRNWLDRMVATSRWPREVDNAVMAILKRHDIMLEERPDPVFYRVEDAVVDARDQLRIAERSQIRRQFDPIPAAFSLPALDAFASAGSLRSVVLTVLVNSRWGRKRFRAVATKSGVEAMPGLAMNARELRRLMGWYRRHAASRPPPFVVCEFTVEADGLTRITPSLSASGYRPIKCDLELADAQPDTVVPINYVEHGLSGVLAHVPGTVYNIDVQTDEAGARAGVIFFVPAAPELHACIKLVPRFDMGAYVVFERAIAAKGGLRIAEALPETYVARFGVLIRDILSYWSPL